MANASLKAPKIIVEIMHLIMHTLLTRAVDKN